jgi:hypothetical protein
MVLERANIDEIRDMFLVTEWYSFKPQQKEMQWDQILQLCKILTIAFL